MQQVHLADQLYQEAKQRAHVAGFASVDEFVAEVLRNDFADVSENLDDRFTPIVNAHLNRIAAEMKEGKSLDIKQVEANIEEARAEWRKNQTA